MNETEELDELSASVLDPMEHTHPDKIDELSCSALVTIDDEIDTEPEVEVEVEECVVIDAEVELALAEEIAAETQAKAESEARPEDAAPEPATRELRISGAPVPQSEVTNVAPRPPPSRQDGFEPVTLPKSPASLCGIADFSALDFDDAVTRPRAFRALVLPRPPRLPDLAVESDPSPKTRPASVPPARRSSAPPAAASPAPRGRMSSASGRKRLASLPPVAPLPTARPRSTLPPPRLPPHHASPIALPPLPLPFVKMPSASPSATTVRITPRRTSSESRSAGTIPPRRSSRATAEVTEPVDIRKLTQQRTWPEPVRPEPYEPDGRPSAPPVEGYVLPDREPAPWMRVVPVAAGALVGVAIFLLALLVGESRGRYASRSLEDSLVVTVAGPGGQPISDTQIFIDGARRCEASPCRVPELSSGLHFVAVSSPGFVATAARVVRIESGEPAVMHFELVRSDRPRQPSAPTSEEERPTIAPSALPAEHAANVATGPAPSATGAPALPPRGMPIAAVSRLNLNSIPSSNVVVDGRPLGQTPKLGVPVEPGLREIVFVHPDHGRLARSVQLAAGELQTIAVRF